MRSQVPAPSFTVSPDVTKGPRRDLHHGHRPLRLDRRCGEEGTKICIHAALESLFPIINNGPLRSLESWRDHGNLAVSAFGDEKLLRSLIVSDECSGTERIGLINNSISPDNRNSQHDSTAGGDGISSGDSISARGADVYLYTSGIDALNRHLMEALKKHLEQINQYPLSFGNC